MTLCEELGLDPRQLDWARRITSHIRRAGRYQTGAVCAVACALAESGLWMYANSRNPQSLTLPHDRIGSDHGSVGLFQQQVGGAPASTADWGTTRQLMDVDESTRRFMAALDRTSWRSRGLTRWHAIQQVQGSISDDGAIYRDQDERATHIVAALW